MAVTKSTKKPAVKKVPVKKTTKTNSSVSKSSSKKSFDKLLDNLSCIYSKAEIERLRDTFAQLKTLKKVKAKLIRPIVPIREWLESPYYVGSSVNTLFDYWKRALIEIFEHEEKTGVKINQVILTGAQGVGKTTAAILIILRRIYELSCYENIARLFNLDSISRIAFAYLSVTKDQAMNSGFAKLVEWVDDIPYFREHFRRKEGLDSMVVWPEERMFVTVGSTHNHFIGLDMIGAILDEANFRESAGNKDNDYNINKKILTLYSQMITRSQTRFIVNGVNHSLAILVSSTTHVGSFTEEVIKKTGRNKNTKVYSPALWDVKPESYDKGKFLVYAGGNNIEPFIIDSLEGINLVLEAMHKKPIYDVPLDELYEKLPTDIQQFVIEVPEEHLDVFKLNIIEGLQSLAGYSVASISKFFRNYNAYNDSIADNLNHPFIQDDITLSNTSNSFEQGYQPIKFYLKPDFEFKNKKNKHFIHLDLALSGDAAGIAMSHIADYKPIYEKALTDDMQKYGEDVEYDSSLPIVTVDFMLKINPPKKPNKISLPKIRDFIIYLKQVENINIELVTADQFQSAQILQELKEFGINTANLSVDRTPEPYFTLTNLIDEGRVKMYKYLPFEDELFNLVFYAGPKKIDHPKDGSKDVSDAAAGAVFNAVKSNDKLPNDNKFLLDMWAYANTDNDSGQNDEVTRAINNLVNILKNS